MKSEIPKEIVFALFSGNATVIQKEIIKQWLVEPNNAETYFEWLQEWESANNHFTTDTKQAFHKFEWQTKSIGGEAQFQKSTESDEIVDNKPFHWKLISAAIFIVCCTLSLGYQLSEIEYKTGFRETKRFTLPDSSTVVLNANSKLNLQRFGFGYLSRKVFLEGEAEFKVKHTIDNLKFIVLTPDKSKVTVLGTEFTVYSRGNETSVVLNKGKVLLSGGLSSSPKTMIPGEKATIRKEGAIELKKLNPKEINTTNIWQEHNLEFQNTPLSAVVNQLHDTFGVEIIISDSNLKNRQLTGSFKTKDPDELLQVLSEMMHLDVKINNAIIYLNDSPQ